MHGTVRVKDSFSIEYLQMAAYERNEFTVYTIQMKIIIIKIKKFENNLNFGPPFVFFQTGRCITID